MRPQEITHLNIKNKRIMPDFIFAKIYFEFLICLSILALAIIPLVSPRWCLKKRICIAVAPFAIYVVGNTIMMEIYYRLYTEIACLLLLGTLLVPSVFLIIKKKFDLRHLLVAFFYSLFVYSILYWSSLPEYNWYRPHRVISIFREIAAWTNNFWILCLLVKGFVGLIKAAMSDSIKNRY